MRPPGTRNRWLIEACFGILTLASTWSCGQNSTPGGDQDADTLPFLGDVFAPADVLEVGETKETWVLPDLRDTKFDLDLQNTDLIVPGAFGAPCKSNEDCDSNFCVLYLGNYICSKTCQEDCPEGWACKLGPSGPDLLFFCQPIVSELCRTCSTADDCTGEGDMCLPIGEGDGAGLYCTSDCSTTGLCPEGYECTEVPPSSPEGATTRQCLPKSGSCVCLGEVDGTTRPCQVENIVGKCLGTETCQGPLGWAGCTASTPSLESCDTVDNDCDGTVDETFEMADWNGELRKIGDSCGTGICSGGKVVCQNSMQAFCSTDISKAEEVCNDIDDDCDGTVDDLVKITYYVDLDEDGYGSAGQTIEGCVAPEGYSSNDDDCDDNSQEKAPGNPEFCDQIDNNCNEVPDDNVVDCLGSVCWGDGDVYFEAKTDQCVEGKCEPGAPESCGLFTCALGGPNGTQCATFCLDDANCVLSAHCDKTTSVCVTDLMNGAPCLAPNDCKSGVCVDGVCCLSACSGICQACNLPGSEGGCAPIPVGQDPAEECAGFPCSGYFAGWSALQCFASQDVPAQTASCNGASGCQAAGELCPGQPMGAAVLTCEPTCQAPNLASCMGTTAGSCTNLDIGVLTCGTGECYRQVSGCVNGLPNVCQPGQPVPETCDNRDEDCDGQQDNAIPGLDEEAPNSCDSAKFVNDVTEGQSESLIAVGTIYPAGDVDYWRFKAFESRDHILHSHGFKTTFRLELPQGADCADYDIYVYGEGTCDFLASSSQSSCTQEIATYSWGGSVFWDDKGFKVKIEPKNGAQWECKPYKLYARMVEN